MPGSIIFEGPSLLDDQPIFVAAVWSSDNRKTGDMLQTYIMRADINPLEASKLGEDYSICGDCKHRGTPTLDPERKQAEARSCYVQLYQGPLVVWREYQAGKYPRMDSMIARADIGRGQRVRLGTYGDPAVVPAVVWEQLIKFSKGWTGYTHQIALPQAQAKAWMTMVSVDSLSEAKAAWRSHQRTFRVVRETSELVKGQEILCPASAEAGKRVQCAQCMLCGGSHQAARSIAVVAHGAGKGYV